jgi:formylglycine-generating enzyme required for sulfatase activity
MRAAALAMLLLCLASGCMKATKTIINSIGMELIEIPAGKFTMGSPTGEKGHQPREKQVAVTLTKPFGLGKTEVTQGQWKQVMGTEPWKGEDSVQADKDCPATYVSWDDATEFCKKLATIERKAGNLQANEEYRLPTEAEWEFAAGAGRSYRLPWGDELMLNGRLPCNIWQGKFPNDPAIGWTPSTVPVKSYSPNAWGIYQTSGNVWEWCADWFSPNYHQQTHSVNPFYDRLTGKRSMRGGSFLCHDSYCNRYRIAARGSNTPETSTSNIGFRVAIS